MLQTSRFIQRQLTPLLNKSVRTSAVRLNVPNSESDENPKAKAIVDQNAVKQKKQLIIEQQRQQEEKFTPFRYVYPEFLPDPRIDWRNRMREKLERIDMLRRRSNLEIPEFYVGSIMKVTVSDKNSPGKANTFVGLCTERGGCGLRAWFVLRNAVDGQGVEILYEMYAPIVQSIIVLKLEKRLDENLRYLRDCAIEHSTFPFDMTPEVRSPDAPVPINAIKVKLKPKPWCASWHLWNLQGVEDFSDQIPEWQKIKWERYKNIYNTEYDKYDLMKTYRSTIPVEEQVEVFGEVHQKLAKLTQTLRSQKKKRTFVRPQKQG